jgi:hypothetical protein
MRLSVLRTLYEVFNDDREKVQRAITSLENGDVSLQEIESGEYFSHEDSYYSNEDYVTTENGDVLHRDDAFYCNGYDEWYHEDDMVTVNEGRDANYYSRQWVENRTDEYAFYEGEWYDNSAQQRHCLVYAQDTNELIHEDNAYYHDGDGYYTYEPDETEEYVRGYHNGSYQSINFDGKSKYRIGYEIEKEDSCVLESINIQDFESNTDYKWRKERDGSLNDERGYELISPTFEFNIDKIFEHIESYDVLVEHINAKYSTSCGGHIHLSEKNLNGEQLFEKIKGYTPLLYALYYGRVDKSFCKGKANKDLAYENEKYQAIKIHHDRVEFRIISAVVNVKTLKWRTKLLMMILQNPTHDVIRAYYNVDTKFTKLLKQTYTDNKLVDLKERFIKFTKQFEGIDIK